MSVLTIARMGHPILAQTARPIPDPADPRWRQLVADMTETMLAAGGIGLAAPQVAVGVQLVLFSVPASRSEDGRDWPLTALFNPEITPLSEETFEAYEGCLSLPGLTGMVPRWTHIHYRGLGLDGRLIEREATGFHARVLQHECDHLWGRLYPSRMADLTSLAYRDELIRLFDENMPKGDMALEETPQQETPK
jgi:peptide deformylase